MLTHSPATIFLYGRLSTASTAATTNDVVKVGIIIIKMLFAMRVS